MTTFYVLPAHAATALSVDVSRLNDLLPRAGDGFDADALLRSPQYARVLAEQEAIRRKMAEHSHGAHPFWEPATPAEVKRQQKVERAKARRARLR